MTTPKCRQCDKPLRPQKKLIERHPTPEEWRDYEAMQEWLKLQQDHLTKRHGRGSEEIVAQMRVFAREGLKRFQKAHPDVRVYSRDVAWYQPKDGSFGYMGEGYFCTQKCGYDWALHQIKRQDGAAKVLAAGRPK